MLSLLNKWSERSHTHMHSHTFTHKGRKESCEQLILGVLQSYCVLLVYEKH